MGFFDRLKAGLAKTRERLLGAIPWGGNPEEVLEELETALLAADVGLRATEELLEALRASGRKDLKEAVKEKLVQMLEPEERRATLRRLGFKPQTPKAVEPKGHVVMVVGVNGVGKTTTVAKLGHYYRNLGKKVLLGAGDTFRAAGSAQLVEWAERLGLPVIQGQEGADPAALAFDAATARRARGYDLLLLDTAGRLHTKGGLMEELKKVKRAIHKADPGEPGEVWLVLDAVTGQNGLEQAKRFHEAVGLTGVIVTKLDGTAKGGVVVQVVEALKVPVRFIGVGEGPEDLQPFDPEAFVEALLEA
ncbi:signal recognition particle-docking protein FtsY [Thermus oshimai]|jgi:fused signal recognition particle receptor|uniref:signal recognition particle-docking protein FtsY n=1 Tax=Thermus TaxID=270 RepID=UPI0030A4746E